MTEQAQQLAPTTASPDPEKQKLMQRVRTSVKVIGAFAGLGDVFTDAPESAASVAAARNLLALSSMLSKNWDHQPVAAGVLHIDGGAVAVATVAVDGTLTLKEMPQIAGLTNRNWTIQLTSNQVFPVEFFDAENPEDATWMITSTDFLKFLAGE